MKIDRSKFANAEIAKDFAPSEALRLAVAEAQAKMLCNFAASHEALKPLLEELHGIPVVLWMRMAQDEYGRSGNISFAHIIRSLCARTGRKEPAWVSKALLEQSDKICEEALRFQLGSRVRQKNVMHRAVRDFRLVSEISKTVSAKNLSHKKAFSVVTNALPANAHGERISAQTPKRAWRRYCSTQNYDQLYKG